MFLRIISAVLISVIVTGCGYKPTVKFLGVETPKSELAYIVKGEKTVIKTLPRNSFQISSYGNFWIKPGFHDVGLIYFFKGKNEHYYMTEYSKYIQHIKNDFKPNVKYEIGMEFKPEYKNRTATPYIKEIGYILNFIYNKKKYRTPEEALEAQKKNWEKELSQISYSSETINKNLLFITPTPGEIRSLVEKRNKRLEKKGYDYSEKATNRFFLYCAEYLRKSNLFADVKHIYNNSPVEYAVKLKGEYPLVIYFKKESKFLKSFIFHPQKGKPKEIVSTYEGEVSRIKGIINYVKNEVNQSEYKALD